MSGNGPYRREKLDLRQTRPDAFVDVCTGIDLPEEVKVTALTAGKEHVPQGVPWVLAVVATPCS
jgi:hypothetical protein